MVDIERIIKTCDACPSQWDVWLADGTYLYVRYRWGELSVGSELGYDDIYLAEIGDDMDGVMSTDEMKEHLAEILEAAD